MPNNFPQIDSKIGKDITNFVSGYYDNTGTTKRGYVYCYPDGVWSDAKNILVGYLKNNVFIYRMALTLTDINSSMYTLRKKTYSYIGSTDTYTEVTGSGNAITKEIISSEIASQQLSNNTQLIEAINSFGAELNDYTEFCNWIETKAYSIDMIDGMLSLDDSGYYKVNFANTKIYFTEKKFTIIMSEQNILPIYLYWYTEIKGLTLKKGISTDDNELNIKFISEWTLYVNGLDSGNPLFTWRWASNSFDNKHISQEESTIEIEYGTFWNEDMTNLVNDETIPNAENPPKKEIIKWSSNDFNITTEEIWAITNSKPSVFDPIFDQTDKRKIFFRLKSKCGEYESDGIMVLLWAESGYMFGTEASPFPDGYKSYGEDTYRYITEVTPPDTPDEDNDGENDESDNGENNGNPTSSAQLGTTYTIAPTTFRALRQWLWSADFIDNIKLINNNPIENIVSAKVFPFEQGGIPTNILLGNVDSKYIGQMQRTTVRKFSDISLNVPTYYNNYLDYTPYTDVKIHLPFVGIKPLDTAVVMGKTINVRYLVDLVLGQCQCDILLKGRVINSYVGMIGTDLPISGQNRSEVEIGYITNALTTAFSAIAGEPIGAVIGISNGISHRFRTETSGQYNPNMQMYSDYDIYLIIERPTLTIPSNYGSTVGYPLNRSGIIRSFSGYTICDNVDTSSIKALSEEREEIKNIMENGFYI